MAPREKQKQREERYRRFAEAWGSISAFRRSTTASRFDVLGRALQRAAEASPEARARLLETYREAGADEGRKIASAAPVAGDPAAAVEAAVLLAGAEAEFTERGPRRWTFRIRGLPPADAVAGLRGELLLAATTAYLEGFLEVLLPGLKPLFDLSDQGELSVRLERR